MGKKLLSVCRQKVLIAAGALHFVPGVLMDHFYRTLFIMTNVRRNLFSAGRRHKNLGSEISVSPGRRREEECALRRWNRARGHALNNKKPGVFSSPPVSPTHLTRLWDHRRKELTCVCISPAENSLSRWAPLLLLWIYLIIYRWRAMKPDLLSVSLFVLRLHKSYWETWECVT